MPIVHAIADVDEAVARQLGAVHRAAELLRGRRVGIVGPRVGIVGPVAVGAPVALHRAAARIDDHDALVQVAVGEIRLVCVGVDRDLGDTSEAGAVVAVGNPGHDAAGSLRRTAARAGAAELTQEHAGAREREHVRVAVTAAAEPHRARAIDGNAMVRLGPVEAVAGTAPRIQHAPGGVELEHRRRRQAALGDRRVTLEAALIGAERLRPVHDPHVILLVHGHADHGSEHPAIGERLRPEGIDVEVRSLDTSARRRHRRNAGRFRGHRLVGSAATRNQGGRQQDERPAGCGCSEGLQEQARRHAVRRF